MVWFVYKFQNVDDMNIHRNYLAMSYIGYTLRITATNDDDVVVVVVVDVVVVDDCFLFQLF